MHNKPTDDEISIVKDIFKTSLNEYVLARSPVPDATAVAYKDGRLDVKGNPLTSHTPIHQFPAAEMTDQELLSVRKPEPSRDFFELDVRPGHNKNILGRQDWRGYDAKGEIIYGSKSLGDQVKTSTPTAPTMTTGRISPGAAKKLQSMGFTPNQLPPTDSGVGAPAAPSQLDRELGGKSPTERLKAMQARWDAEKMDNLSKRADGVSKKVDELEKEITTPWNVSTPTPVSKPTTGETKKMSDAQIQSEIIKTVTNIVNKPSAPSTAPQFPGKRDSSTGYYNTQSTPQTTNNPVGSGVLSTKNPPQTVPSPTKPSNSDISPAVSPSPQEPEPKRMQTAPAVPAAPAKPSRSDEDLVKIVPGSQMWGELSGDEQRKVAKHYAGGKTSLSIRHREGKGFDEAGYGDQGQYGDIVKALNRVQMQESYYTRLSAKLDEAKTEPSGAEINLAAYGYNPNAKGGGRGGRNARRALDSLRKGMWRGDSSSTSDDVKEKIPENIGERELTGENIKSAVATLYSAAMDHPEFEKMVKTGEFGKAQIMSPSSSVHKRLLSLYPEGHEVHAASAVISAAGNR